MLKNCDKTVKLFGHVVRMGDVRTATFVWRVPYSHVETKYGLWEKVQNSKIANILKKYRRNFIYAMKGVSNKKGLQKTTAPTPKSDAMGGGGRSPYGDFDKKQIAEEVERF